ncbi:Myb-like DNA-binding domain [Rhizoctonia solani]|uniref:Myb-like DNA-binding domain n=1 Tax=Rhizoctonia solani TaxID=456999 RepID=A0A8H7M9C4_9AGAM|nr:Myb-like DNA-binding domain [Rhizoctonia solani]
MDNEAIDTTQKALGENTKLQEQLSKYIQDLENEQDQLDKLINNLSKVESALPEGSPNKEAGEVDTAVYGTHFEGLRHTLTAKQLAGDASPFRKTVEQRQWYEQMTTTRPFTRDETRLLHTSVILENKRLYALRAQARGENPFTTVQQFPDSYFDVNDPEINWNSVAQNMDSIPPRSADQCRIMYVSTELPAISHSNWSSEEYEKLKQIVEIHNEASSEPVADVERDREKLRVDWVEISQELGTNRTTLQCLRKFIFEPSPLEVASKDKENPGGGTSKGRDRAAGNPWSDDEDKFLLEGIQRHGMGNWPEVALHLNAAMAGRPNHVARTPNQCSFRYSKSLCPTIKKGKWTKEEDQALRKGVASFGRMWTKVQEYVQGRTDAQCRERWSNMLDPSLKTGPWEEEEDKILFDAASQKLPWSKISALLPGRTDSRCAKRYQMLIKLRDGGLSPAEAQAQASNRGKKRKEAQASPQSPSGEEAPVASGDLDRGPLIFRRLMVWPRLRLLLEQDRSLARPKPKGQAKVVVSEGGMLQNKKGKAPVNSLEGVQEITKCMTVKMPKAATTTKTTKAAKEPKEPKETKEKTPSPYQRFMKERLPTYKAEHPDVSHKDAFRAVALEWKDADANPNKGKVREEKPKPKPKEKADKEAAPKKKRATKKAAPVASSEGEDDKEADEDEESS